MFATIFVWRARAKEVSSLTKSAKEDCKKIAAQTFPAKRRRVVISPVLMLALAQTAATPAFLMYQALCRHYPRLEGSCTFETCRDFLSANMKVASPSENVPPENVGGGDTEFMTQALVQHLPCLGFQVIKVTNNDNTSISMMQFIGLMNREVMEGKPYVIIHGEWRQTNDTTFHTSPQFDRYIQRDVPGAPQPASTHSKAGTTAPRNLTSTFDDADDMHPACLVVALVSNAYKNEKAKLKDSLQPLLVHVDNEFANVRFKNKASAMEMCKVAIDHLNPFQLATMVTAIPAFCLLKIAKEWLRDFPRNMDDLKLFLLKDLQDNPDKYKDMYKSFHIKMCK